MERRFLLFCMFISLPALTWAVESTVWYGILGANGGQCERLPEIHGPLSFMGLAQLNGWAYRMNDVEENGKLVETTMVASSFTTYGGKLTWYRSRERCEQALRKLRKAQELGQRKLDRYR